MNPETDPVVETPEEPTLDVEDAVQGIAESLHLAEPEPPAEEPAEEAPPAEPAPAASAAEPEVKAPEGDLPPDTWRKEAKEKWAEMPAVFKAEIKKREADIARYVGESQPAMNVAQAFEKVVTPYKGVFEKYGINPWDHVATLLNAHAQLVFGSPEQKVAMFRQLAIDAGIDAGKLGQEDANPAGNPLIQHISALQERIKQLEGSVTGVTTTVQQALAQELEGTIIEFAKDEEHHPFFWDVTDRIQHFIDTRAAKTLQEAYDLAVRSDPVTWQKVVEKEALKRAALPNPATAHAANARKTVSANVRASGRGRPASPPASIDDTLKETMAKIHSREST